MSFDNTDKLKKILNLGAKFFTTKSSNHWNFWAVLGPVGLTCFVILLLILFVSTKLLPDLFNILLFQYKLNVIIVLSNLKHSVPKKCSIQNLFIRKTFHVLFWANLCGLSYMGGGLLIRSCQEGGVSQMHFPVTWTLWIWRFTTTILAYTLEN